MNETISLAIPADIENMQLPNPALLDFYKDANKRIFWIDEEIDGDAFEIVKTIIRINHEDSANGIPVEQRKPIKIFIDTPGGSVHVMRAIINAIKISKTPVYTIACCAAMSAGSYILAEGHKRFAMQSAIILVHSGGVGFQGTVEQVESAKKFFDKLTKSDDENFIARTNVNAKDLKRKGALDWYMTAEEALHYGVVDTIIQDFDEVM